MLSHFLLHIACFLQILSLVSVVFKAPAMWERESLYETWNNRQGEDH